MTLRAFLPWVVVGAALAQGPFGPRRPMNPAMPAQTPTFTELKAYLNLSDSQLQSIQQARQQAMTSQQTVITQIRDKHQALRDLLDKGTSDAAAVGKLMLDIRALEKQIEQARTTTRNQLLGFLTADQKTKLAALEQAAKQLPLIHQGAMLGLLEPPAPGPGFLGGPGGFGPMRQPSGVGARARRRPAHAML